MLLRRITKHVKEQNWFAVVLDFLIVVFGIYIGLQVQNWSEQQNDRKLERHYLERLIEDMETSIARNNRGIGFIKYNQENAWVVHQSLSNCNIPKGKENQFADGLYQIGRFVTVSYDLGTVREMQSGGSFSIIRSSQIRKHLNTLLRQAREYLEILPPINARVGPLLVQFDRYLVANLENIKPNSGSVIYEDIEVDLQSMCDDKELLPALSTIRSINQFHIDGHNMAIKALKTTRAALQAELGLKEEVANQ